MEFFEKCVLPQDSEARSRMDTLCRMLNRDCPLKHIYIVVDVANENEKCTVILDNTEERETLSESHWIEVANDLKPLNVVENEIFNSSFYRFRLL